MGKEQIIGVVDQLAKEKGLSRSEVTLDYPEVVLRQVVDIAYDGDKEQVATDFANIIAPIGDDKK
jgi:hypothetical protein